MDWQTPMGLTHVVSKEKNPTWNPPASVRAEHLANGDPLPRGAIGPGPTIRWACLRCAWPFIRATI